MTVNFMFPSMLPAPADAYSSHSVLPSSRPWTTAPQFPHVATGDNCTVSLGRWKDHMAEQVHSHAERRDLIRSRSLLGPSGDGRRS